MSVELQHTETHQPHYGTASPPPQYANTPPPMGGQGYPPQQNGAPYSANATSPPPGDKTERAAYFPDHQQPQQAHYPPQQQGQYPPQGYQSPQQPYYSQQQPGGMPPQQQQGQTYQNVTPLASLQSSPAPVQCPSCGQRHLTRTNNTTGNTTHGWAALVCFLTCLGCIPYLISSLKDVEHRCSNCGVLLAKWHRSGRTEVMMHS